MTRAFIAIALAGSIATAAAHDSVVYHPVPLALDPIYHLIDFDEDGTADYLIEGYYLISLPSPGFPNPGTAPVVDSISLNGGDYLMGPDMYGTILLKPAGYLFGPETVPGEIWSHQQLQGQIISLAWIGLQGLPPEGYVGVRFLSGGRLHYGWMRFLVPTRLTAPSQRQVIPILAEWAYETRPDTAIRAGDIGQTDKPLWFTVDFLNPDDTPNGSTSRRSTAAFVLVGDTLSYEMTLGDYFLSADIQRPVGSEPKPKSVLSLAPPLLSLPGFTIFSGETKLSRPEANHLRQNKLLVSLDGGATVGRILRVDH